jgi:hypothetical protein
VAAKLDALAVVATGDDQRIEAERQRQELLLAESGKQLAMLAERERQLPRTVRHNDDDDDDDDAGLDKASTPAAESWKSLFASRTTTRAGHAAAAASLQVLSEFSDKATGIGGDIGCGGGGGGGGGDGGGGGCGGGGGGGGPGPLTQPPQHQQHTDQMRKRMEALRQEALSAQNLLHDTQQRLDVALELVVQQQQLLHKLGASPTSLLPIIKPNAVAPVVVRDANVNAKQRWRAHSDLDGSSSTSNSSAINTSASTSAINSDVGSNVGSSHHQPHTDEEDAACMAFSAPRDQALELHSSKATTQRSGDSDSSSLEIGADGGADPSMTALTSTVGHTLGRRAPRRVVRRIVPKSAATTGQQQQRSVLNDRRQVTFSPSATGSAAPAAEALEALEAARHRKKAADAKARAAKARKALSPEYMRKAAAAMFKKASVAQQNATQRK